MRNGPAAPLGRRRTTARGPVGPATGPVAGMAGGGGDGAARVASRIRALGRRDAPRGARGTLGACDTAVGRRRSHAPRRERGARRVTPHSLKISLKIKPLICLNPHLLFSEFTETTAFLILTHFWAPGPRPSREISIQGAKRQLWSPEAPRTPAEKI